MYNFIDHSHVCVCVQYVVSVYPYHNVIIVDAFKHITIIMFFYPFYKCP